MSRPLQVRLGQSRIKRRAATTLGSFIRSLRINSFMVMSQPHKSRVAQRWAAGSCGSAQFCPPDRPWRGWVALRSGPMHQLQKPGSKAGRGQDAAAVAPGVKPWRSASATGVGQRRRKKLSKWADQYSGELHLQVVQRSPFRRPDCEVPIRLADTDR